MFRMLDGIINIANDGNHNRIGWSDGHGTVTLQERYSNATDDVNMEDGNDLGGVGLGGSRCAGSRNGLRETLRTEGMWWGGMAYPAGRTGGRQGDGWA